MKRLVTILFALGLALNSFATTVFTYGVEFNALNNWSSYDSAQLSAPSYVLGGAYMHSGIAGENPAVTNHFYSVGRGGVSWTNDIVEDAEDTWHPLMASWKTPGFNLMLPQDNGGNGSNDIWNVGPLVVGVTNNSFNGTAFTNEAITFPIITTIPCGGIPDSDHTSSSLAKGREDACTNLAVLWGVPQVRLRTFLETSGVGTNASRFPGGHPFPDLSLCMAMFIMQAIGVDTNVAQLTLDWSSGAATLTNHCTATGVSVAGNTLIVGALRFDRMPMGWDIAGINHFGESVTNSAQSLFTTLYPPAADWFNYSIQVVNLPVGNYTAAIDGVTIATLSSTVLANGWNMFTNTVGPLWWQRVAVLNACRDQRGVNHTNLIAHTAANKGTLGVDDMINYGSTASGNYTGGARGSALVSSLATEIAHVQQYDVAIQQAAIQTNHTFSLTLIQPRFAPFLHAVQWNPVSPADCYEVDIADNLEQFRTPARGVLCFTGQRAFTTDTFFPIAFDKPKAFYKVYAWNGFERSEAATTSRQ